MENPALAQQAEEISSIRKGNEFILKKIYKENFPMILKLVKTNSGDEDDAKDIYQEAFIVFYEKVKDESFELNCTISTFLYSVSRNLWLKRLRKLSNDGTVLMNEDDDYAEVEEEVEKHEEKENFLSSVQKSLEIIGEPCRTILTDFFYHKLSMQEIAQKMHYTNADNAKNQKYKCFNRLKKLVMVSKRS